MPTRPSLFRPPQYRSHQEQRREADERRGSARERGYDAKWDRAAAGHRRRHPLCVGCDAVGRVKTADVTDHIEPHKGDQAKLWDKDNWQSACRWHHDVVKQRLEGWWLAGRIGIAELRLDSATAIALTQELGG